MILKIELLSNQLQVLGKSRTRRDEERQNQTTPPPLPQAVWRLLGWNVKMT